MSIELNNVVTLVTGAAGGIGRAVCQALQAAGAVVIATDLAEDPGDMPASNYFTHDVTSAEDWQKIADQVMAEHGRLDALVNAAAQSAVATIEATEMEVWRRIQAINVESLLLAHQIMLPLLKKGGEHRKSGASIVNFSSIGGQKGAAFQAAYCTSKGAVKIFSKCAAIEFAALGYNIRVNSVHPGGVNTPMLSSIIDSFVASGGVASYAEAEAGIIANHPIGRLGEPEDIGGGVVYLCSQAAGFVTGSELNIDGGFTAV